MLTLGAHLPLNTTGLANAYGIALSAIFASNTFLAFVVFRKIWHKPLWLVIPGAVFFITVELTFFAANLPKVESGGWLPLVVGAVFCATSPRGAGDGC